MRLAINNMSDEFYDQPSWWQNFFSVLLAKQIFDGVPKIEYEKIINEKLMEWGGHIIKEYTILCPDGFVAVEFEDDADATWFLLRWA